MQNTEIAEGLRSLLDGVLQCELTEHEEAFITAALALIEPQPITEAALREAGFVLGAWLHLIYQIDGPRLCVLYDGERFLLFVNGTTLPLPNITDMQTLRTVIAALGGEVRDA